VRLNLAASGATHRSIELLTAAVLEARDRVLWADCLAARTLRGLSPFRLVIGAGRAHASIPSQFDVVLPFCAPSKRLVRSPLISSHRSLCMRAATTSIRLHSMSEQRRAMVKPGRVVLQPSADPALCRSRPSSILCESPGLHPHLGHVTQNTTMNTERGVAGTSRLRPREDIKNVSSLLQPSAACTACRNCAKCNPEQPTTPRSREDGVQKGV
jgi:hypothetical protein